MISKKTIKALEFDKILNILSSFAVSEAGKSQSLQINFANSSREAEWLLAETYEADKILYAHALSPEFSFDCVEEILTNAEKLITLSMGDLLKIARLLKLSRNFYSLIDKINDTEIIYFKDYIMSVFVDQILENEINQSILSEFEMADNASSELSEIRKAIARCYVNIKNKLNQYTSGSTYSKYLQDSIVTIRNNRYVIPVKCEFKNNIQGLVHDQSASGATVFIEPFEIVQLNNEIATLKANENEEIERILKVFTVKVANEADMLKTSYAMMVKADCIFARAKFAHSYKAERPQINDKGIINIIKGRHPLIEKEKVVPISLSLDDQKRVLLITGPNTGGKTVTLKLVGLFSLMAMSGIFPPCEYGSKISVYESVFCDIGDEQSIEQSLSTFSSHLTNLINITNNMNKSTLILLDELGAGTDPIEGACLALAITKAIISVGASAIITTHYQQMKEFALTDENTLSASMDFDPQTFAPTYRLLMGASGASNAIQIARRLGLKKEIIESATSFLSDDKIQFDKIILSAERARREAEEDRVNISRLKREAELYFAEASRERENIIKEREKLNLQMRKEAKKILEDYIDEAEDAIVRIKEIVNAPSEDGLHEARKLKSKLANITYLDQTNENIVQYDNSPIIVGDKVYIKSLDKYGLIVSEDNRKKEYTVKIGSLSTVLKYNKVRKIKQNNVFEEVERQNTVNLNKPINRDNVSMELNIIGQHLSEAVANVETFVDSAVLSGLHELRIVHGKGMGILRKAVGEYLKTNKNVDSFRLGNYGEGDHGVTIVVLK